MALPDLDDVRRARAVLAGHVHETPLLSATRLGRLAGVRLSLKCESFQKTGSFKARGAFNKLSRLDAASRARGVVTVSAGNHAQALAWAASETGIRCTVVMPNTASRTKAEASAGYGAEVILHGTATDAFAKARELAAERGLTFVHPFDDPDIVAGAATAGLELVEQAGADEIDAVVVGIGGGGLISGIATAVKALAPHARVYGVEPTGASTMRISLDAGRASRIDSISTIAEGLAPPMAGELNFEIVSRLVEDVVLVSDGEILDAMRRLMTLAKLVVEPSGAAATAAVLSGRIPFAPGSRVVVLVSGGNVDLPQLRELLPAS